MRPKSECPAISWVEWYPRVPWSQTCNNFAVCWFLQSQWSFLSSLINIDLFREENRANSNIEEYLPHRIYYIFYFSKNSGNIHNRGTNVYLSLSLQYRSSTRGGLCLGGWTIPPMHPNSKWFVVVWRIQPGT